MSFFTLSTGSNVDNRTGNKIKAIETRYKGYRFRSRLEARWAVFFDALGLKWEYEPEGFHLSNGECYLPDFYLPELGNGTFIEIKGANPSDADRVKCHLLAQGSNKEVVLLHGEIGLLYKSQHEDILSSIIGDVFVPYDYVTNPNNCGRGVGLEHLYWILMCNTLPFLEDLGLIKQPATLDEIIQADCLYYFNKHGKQHPCYSLGFVFLNDYDVSVSLSYHCNKSITEAIMIARSARFEHGEKG